MMNKALWALQFLLAVLFAAAGFFKVATPLEELAVSLAYVADTPGWVTRLAGASELLGAVGLILPSVTRIKPVLTPIAAACLALVMVLALGLHVSRGEPFVPNVVLGALCAFVAWGRFTKVPIASKSADGAKPVPR